MEGEKEEANGLVKSVWRSPRLLLAFKGEGDGRGRQGGFGVHVCVANGSMNGGREVDSSKRGGGREGGGGLVGRVPYEEKNPCGERDL